MGSTFAQSESAEDAFVAAHNAYQEGNFGRACFMYSTIIEEGQHSPTLYNNLGIAYLKDNKLGQGILAFERALRLDPNHTEAQRNLAYAKRLIHEPVKENSSGSFWKSIYCSLSSFTWSCILFSLISVAFVFLFMERIHKRLSYVYIALGTFLLIVPVFFLGQSRTHYDAGGNEAILTKKQLGLRVKAQLQDKEAWTIYEGTKVLVKEKKDNWYKIRLSNDLEGWVPAQMLNPIGQVTL
ncbi:MAG: SH3 domain-containing protein [Saprospiraceae bacterium]|nr:SH3 domain-containing protein [Saprospiraceae bacterium]